MVDSAVCGDEPGAGKIPYEPHCFPGDPETAFCFRTDWLIAHIFPQSFNQPVIILMLAVIANFIAQKAGTDPQYWHIFHN